MHLPPAGISRGGEASTSGTRHAAPSGRRGLRPAVAAARGGSRPRPSASRAAPPSGLRGASDGAVDMVSNRMEGYVGADSLTADRLGDAPPGHALTPPSNGVAFLLRSVLDAKTISDTTKARLVRVGRDRGIDFGPLVAASDWGRAGAGGGGAVWDEVQLPPALTAALDALAPAPPPAAADDGAADPKEAPSKKVSRGFGFGGKTKPAKAPKAKPVLAVGTSAREEASLPPQLADALAALADGEYDDVPSDLVHSASTLLSVLVDRDMENELGDPYDERKPADDGGKRRRGDGPAKSPAGKADTPTPADNALQHQQTAADPVKAIIKTRMQAMERAVIMDEITAVELERQARVAQAAAERAEAERREAEARAEAERLEAERLAAERLAAEERATEERATEERATGERAAKEREGGEVEASADAAALGDGDGGDGSLDLARPPTADGAPRLPSPAYDDDAEADDLDGIAQQLAAEEEATTRRRANRWAVAAFDDDYHDGGVFEEDEEEDEEDEEEEGKEGEEEDGDRDDPDQALAGVPSHRRALRTVSGFVRSTIRDETGARRLLGSRRAMLRPVHWSKADGYMAPALRLPEAADWKAAGVLVYTFDPFGELMLLLGRTVMGSAIGNERIRAWNLLGGKRNRRDATAEATATRELTEETGGLLSADTLRGPLTPVLWYPGGRYAVFPYYLSPGELAYSLPDRFDQRRRVGRASVSDGRDTATLEWIRLSVIMSGRRSMHIFMEDMLCRTRLIDWLRQREREHRMRARPPRRGIAPPPLPPPPRRTGSPRGDARTAPSRRHYDDREGGVPFYGGGGLFDSADSDDWDAPAPPAYYEPWPARRVTEPTDGGAVRRPAARRATQDDGRGGRGGVGPAGPPQPLPSRKRPTPPAATPAAGLGLAAATAFLPPSSMSTVVGPGWSAAAEAGAGIVVGRPHEPVPWTGVVPGNSGSVAPQSDRSDRRRRPPGRRSPRRGEEGGGARGGDGGDATRLHRPRPPPPASNR